MQTTDNYRKHTSTNPMQKFFIGRFLENVVEEARRLKPESILDVGCGEGFTLEKLRVNNIGKKLEGVDSLDTAIELGKKRHPKLTLKKASIYALPYKDKSFDLVICNEVLEHLEHPHEALGELARVSKKYVLLSVPNEPIFTISNFMRGKNWSRWGNDIEHIQHWSTSSFKKFIQPKIYIRTVKRPFPWTLVVGERN